MKNLEILLPLFATIGLATAKISTTCNEYINGYSYNLESLKGNRFQVPAKDGETLVFGICEDVDDTGGVAYLKRPDKPPKVIGSLSTDQKWTPLIEEDDELGGTKDVGAQVTYFEKDVDLQNQWTFKQRFLCSLDETPVLRAFNVDYNDRIATVDIEAAAACPSPVLSAPTFIRRHWFAMLVGAVGISLLLGLTTGLSYTTYAAVLGLTFGFFSVGYLWMNSVLSNGLRMWQPGTTNTWVFLHSAFGFLLASAAAGACAVFFSQFPTIAVTLAGMFAGVGATGVFEGLAHFINRGILGLSKGTLGWSELIFSFVGLIQGGILCYQYGPKSVPLLGAILGAYGITWTLGFLTNSLPRQADVFAHFESYGRALRMTGNDDNQPIWWPIRGRISLPGAIFSWTLFMACVIGFLVVHMSAYQGVHSARTGKEPVSFHGGVEEAAGNFFEDAGHGRELDASVKMRKWWYDFRKMMHDWMPSVFNSPAENPLFENMTFEESQEWRPNETATVRTPLLDKKAAKSTKTQLDQSTQVSANILSGKEPDKSAHATPVRDAYGYQQAPK